MSTSDRLVAAVAVAALTFAGAGCDDGTGETDDQVTDGTGVIESGDADSAIDTDDGSQTNTDTEPPAEPSAE